MSGTSFDSNIVIDALNGVELAGGELRRVRERWISRVTWIEVWSKVEDADRSRTEVFMTQFDIDEVDLDIATRAAALRNERRRLKLADAVILASAQARGRVLVSRNTKDFPADMPGVRVPYILERQ